MGLSVNVCVFPVDLKVSYLLLIQGQLTALLPRKPSIIWLCIGLAARYLLQ